MISLLLANSKRYLSVSCKSQDFLLIISKVDINSRLPLNRQLKVLACMVSVSASRISALQYKLKEGFDRQKTLQIPDPSHYQKNRLLFQRESSNRDQ